MPYRTSQKPMNITITLTNDELKEAVRDYAAKRKTPIPDNFTSSNFNTVVDQAFNGPRNIIAMEFLFKEPKTK